MASKKKTKRVVQEGNQILFLHVKTATKNWFKQVTHKVGAKEVGKVTQSNVAERILSNLKKSPRLLEQALR